ncbi:MAG: hypothetical protein R3345_14935, partial [Fulvivirga sp.]|nr:hypothetical protein [Fulvivirga sp.]
MSDLQLVINENWPVVILIGVLVSLLLIYKEWVRKNSANRMLRIMALCISIASISLIYLRPAIVHEEAGTEVVVLTEGYDTQQFDSLITERKISDFFLYDTLSFDEKIRILDSNVVFVLGYGLPEGELDIWQAHHVYYIPNNHELTGVSNLVFSAKQHVGDTMVLRGETNFLSEKNLGLSGQGVIYDSIIVKTGKQLFALKAPMKNVGEYIFYLTIDAIDSIALPVTVDKDERIKALMMNAYPTFEFKYLKNYLVGEGHHVTVRNRLTRGRYKYEFYNVAYRSNLTLDEAFLDEIDILISDHLLLSLLSIRETNLIRQKVESGKLSLLILPDREFFTDNRDFNFFNYQPYAEKHVTVEINNKKHQLNAFPYMGEERFGQINLFNNTVLITSSGMGRIGTATVGNTFELILKGDQMDYHIFWRKVLENLIINYEHEVELPWPITLDHAAIFNVGGTTDETPELYIDGVELYPKQDLHFKSNWEASYWPEKKGWHTLSLYNDSISFYVQDHRPVASILNS